MHKVIFSYNIKIKIPKKSGFQNYWNYLQVQFVSKLSLISEIETVYFNRLDNTGTVDLYKKVIEQS